MTSLTTLGKVAIGILLVLLLIGLFAVLSHAQPAGSVVGANCTIKWIANTEADLAGYRVYGVLTMSPTASISTVLDIVKPTASTTCAAMRLQTGGMLAIQVDAVDTLGNRSAKSAAVTVTQDVLAPAQPTGLTVTPSP